MKLAKGTNTRLIRSPMTNYTIEKYFNGHANIKSLQQIERFASLDQVFDGQPYVVIFEALRAPNDGHWVCMFKNLHNDLIYFDSYGEFPLYALDQQKQKYGQGHKLLQLIQQSPYKNAFYYNTEDYQELKDNVQTCGAYATTICLLAVQYLAKDLNLDCDEIHRLFTMWKKKYNRTPDQAVAFFTTDR